MERWLGTGRKIELYIGRRGNYETDDIKLKVQIILWKGRGDLKLLRIGLFSDSY